MRLAQESERIQKNNADFLTFEIEWLTVRSMTSKSKSRRLSVFMMLPNTL